MLSSPGRRVLLRWMFNVLGYLLLFGSNFVVQHLLNVQYWAHTFFGSSRRGYALMIAAGYFYLILTPILCWIAATGLKRNREWGRLTAIAASVLLLLGFPWLTIAGLWGLWEMRHKLPTGVSPGVIPARAATDYWSRKRQSKLQPVVHSILWIAAFVLQGYAALYARRAGLPPWNRTVPMFVWFSLFAILHTALHECGHTIVSWAAGFKVQIVSIGPLTFWREQNRFRYRFDLSRLFEAGGYMGSVPVTEHNLRGNEIAIVAAGPATNALTCLVLSAILVSLPGTPWAAWWWVVSLNALIAGTLAIANMIPVGYCDGSMFFHLVLDTAPGRLLLDTKRVMLMDQEAERCHGRADFDREIELKEAMLARALANGGENAGLIAACRETLGWGYCLVDDFPSAEIHFRRSLEHSSAPAANPTLIGRAWAGIHYVALKRHNPAAAASAYAALLAQQEQSPGASDPTGPAANLSMLAQSRTRHGDYAEALTAIGAALKAVPSSPATIIRRGHLLRAGAICHLGLGQTEAGVEAARNAAQLFRSPDIPQARRNVATEDVADLGFQVACAGQTMLALELMRGAICHLESGGAKATAAQYRIKLATVLRRGGWPSDAAAALPSEDGLSDATRRSLLAERIELHLAAGNAGRAVACARQLAALWRAHPCKPAAEIACADAMLARACLAAGELIEAGALARQACPVLSDWGHPDAASCLVTLALLQAHASGECDPAAAGEALSRIEDAPLLSPYEKAWRLETEKARLKPVTSAATV